MSENQTQYAAVIATPVGRIGLRMNAKQLCAVDFVSGRYRTRQNTAVGEQIQAQLDSYFANPAFQFTLDVAADGTDFQQRVWRELKKIPAGTTVTYGELADRLGSSARAVGNACRANPLPVIVPCHRVVSKTGLGGYMGKTSGGRLKIKSWLLDHEHR